MARNRSILLLTLVPCGQTDWEREDRLVGAADLPLGAAGTEAVAAMRLPPESRGTIHHPPDEAAAATASALAAARDLKARAVPELTDPHLGLLEGLTRGEFAERYPKRFKQWEDDPLALSPPEGEPLADGRARIFSAVARLVRRSRGGEVILVLHKLGLGFLRCWLADRPVREMWAEVERPPAVERFALTMEMARGLDQAAAAAGSRA